MTLEIVAEWFFAAGFLFLITIIAALPVVFVYQTYKEDGFLSGLMVFLGFVLIYGFVASSFYLDHIGRI